MGRKFQILLGNLLFVVGWMLIIADQSSMIMACIGRLVTGIGAGVLSIAVPTYIGEGLFSKI